MSVDQLPKRQPPRRSGDAKLVRYEDFIESKIQSTRRTVKAVDLATALVTLAAGVLGYLLVVAAAEHWIVPGGFSVAARTALFTVLVIGVGYFVYQRVWSLLVRAINPVYAARAIEQGSPTLKNSLINLLFFRERRTGISDAVYRTLEEQAAQRLTRVPVETSVDRSLLIRLGYVLVAVVALAGLYKVFSPKDPLVSAGRILLPWADIVPASRVMISAVTPGSLTVSRGEFVDVSAEVRGLGDDDAVVLRYTTDDRQVVGKAIPMKPAGDGLRYECRLADGADGSDPVGLTRSLTYRLEAGDARSLDYAITVVSAPSILVERVDYDYPAYTGYVDRTVAGLGDIRAIEGTRITIHARANGAIRVADVDFAADGRPDLRMTVKENGASASFELGLREDRQTPRHASYVLRFTNDEGRTNRDPVKHSIAVERDYDPEVSVLLPKEKSIDVRLDETVAIEVEARDPDFALATVRLHGEAAGQSVLDESLLKAEHRGRFTTRYSFVPNAHGLKAGDEVKYWVEAGDNRTPKPNTVTTKDEKRTIRIVSPNPAQQPPPDRVARNDRQQPKPGADQQSGEQDQKNQGGQGQGEKNQGGAAGQSDNADQQQGGESGGQQQSGDKQRQGDDGESASADGKSSPKPGGEGKATNAQGGEQKGNEQKPGESGQGGSQSKSSEGSSDEQQNKGEQTGAGASGGQSSKDAAQPAGTRRPDQPGAGSARPEQGEKQEGEKGRGGEGEKAQPQPAVSSEGDNDGEAFERIQKHMERKGELNGDETQKQDGEKGSGGEGEKKQNEAAKDKSEGENKPADGESASADGKSGAKPGDANQKQQSDQQSKGQSDGAGAKPEGDDAPQNKEQQPDGGSEQQKSPDGQQTGSKGPAGAGDEKQSQGQPDSQPAMKPTDKRQQSGSKEGSDKQEPPAGANSKKESDSSGDQGGDKAGGGEEGAGQKAPREGTGSAGEHQAADEGSGQSAEKGQGDTSPNAGKDSKADRETGSSDGKTPGEGSQQKDGTGEKSGGKDGGEDVPARGGEDSAGKDGEKAEGERAQPNAKQGQADKGGKQAGKQEEKQDGKQDGKQGDQPGKDAGKNKDGEQQGQAGGASGGGGQPGGAVNPQPTITGSAPEGDAANLEYARKQTDLVLDKLSDQLKKNKVDDRMLKELGWTRDDMRRFVERWQQRKDAAQRDDPTGDAAKRELDDALRSLGLGREELQQNSVQKDSMRDLKQGYRGPVPLEYQERLRAYNQGVSRAARDGE